MASGCDHMAHVTSQLPYAITAGVATFVAYIVDGLVNNVIIALIVALVVGIVAINVQHKMTVKKYQDYNFDAEAVPAAKK